MPDQISIPPLARLERATMNLPAQQVLRSGPFAPEQLRGYVFAAAAFAVAFAIRWWLEGSLPPGFPFLTFFPAVVLVSFVFGKYAGILISIASALACWFVFLPGTPVAKLLPVGFFTVIVAIDIVIIDLMHRALNRVSKMHARSERLAAERSLLIREIHHRVGNSLALVASLLRIHRTSNAGGDAGAVLKEAEARVLAISKVQTNLYANDQVHSVSLDGYLAALIDDVKGSIEDNSVEVRLDAQPMSMDHDRAIALGLITTELVINSKKHAFPKGKGIIRVSLKKDEAGLSRLMVSDDGVGHDASRASNSTGVGSKIIAAMAGKLGAEISTESGRAGTTTSVLFPLQADETTRS